MNPHLSYEGSSFGSLPATVGILKDSRRVTEKKAGYLVFGPYSSFKNGYYELSVFGASDFISGAYVDIVSEKGGLVHARFNLEGSEKGFLLKKVSVHIPVNVSDIEVRVWVGDDDKLELRGYTLKPRNRSGKLSITHSFHS
jgi:hypothetical protein